MLNMVSTYFFDLCWYKGSDLTRIFWGYALIPANGHKFKLSLNYICTTQLTENNFCEVILLSEVNLMTELGLYYLDEIIFDIWDRPWTGASMAINLCNQDQNRILLLCCIAPKSVFKQISNVNFSIWSS